MTGVDRLGHLLTRLSGDPGAKDADLAEAEAARQMPDALRRLYRTSLAPDLDGVQLFFLDDYADANALLPEGWVAFADDFGDRWFALAPNGRVVWFSRTDLRPAASHEVANSLAEFLAQVLAGEKRWLDYDPVLAARGRLAALLEAPPSWIETRPPQSFETVRETMRRLHLPRELVDILDATDGLLVPATGARIDGLSGLLPEPAVPSPWDGPAATWIGRAPDGRRSLLMATDLAHHSAGDIVAVREDEGWERGKVLGPLPLVVLRWIEEGRP